MAWKYYHVFRFLDLLVHMRLLRRLCSLYLSRFLLEGCLFLTSSIWHRLCSSAIFLISFYIFSNFPFISFLRSDTSLLVFSVILWVHTCISFSFWKPLTIVVSPSLTEPIFSKLLCLNSSLITLWCFTFRDAQVSLKWGWLCSPIPVLWVSYFFYSLSQVGLLERRILIRLKDEIKQS